VDKKLIVVTGCSGRVGSEIVKRLKDTYAVIGLDIVPTKEPSEDYEFIKVNLGNEESIHSALEQIRLKHGSKITSFIHSAAYHNFKGGEWDMYEKITVKGTEHLLNFLDGFEVDEFIYFSSYLVHQPNYMGNPLNESSPLLGSWELPRSKILAEKITHNLGKKIRSKVILRLAAVYDDTCNSIPLSNQIQRIYEKQFAGRVLPGNAHHGVTYLHMNDLLHCVDILINKRDELVGNHTFLIGENSRLTYDESQRLIQQLIFGVEWRTDRIPKWVAKLASWFQNAIPIWGPSFIKPWMIAHAADNYECNTTKARRELNWQPMHQLKNSIPKMIASLKENPVKWYAQNQLIMPSWLKKKIDKNALLLIDKK